MTCPHCAAPVVPGAAFCRSCGTALATAHAPASITPQSPERLTVSAEMVGRTCPYCRSPLKQGGQAVQCASCHAVHHAECYRENAGCAVNGCAHAPGAAPPLPPEHQTAVMAAAAPPLTVPPAPSLAGMSGIPSPSTLKAPAVPPMAPTLPPSAPYLPQQGVPALQGGRAWKTALIVLGIVLALGGAAAAVVVAVGGKTTNVTTVTQAGETFTEPAPSSDSSTATDSGGNTQSGDPSSGGSTSTGDNADQGGASTDSSTTSSDPGTTTTSAPTASAASNGPGPSTIFRHHLEDINSGSMQQAFALMTPAYRAANPSWPSLREQASPSINVVSIGSASNSGGGTAEVPVDFYARDSVATSGSDTKCREFTGTVHMEKVSGKWRYAPSGNSLDGSVVDSSDPNCP